MQIYLKSYIVKKLLKESRDSFLKKKCLFLCLLTNFFINVKHLLASTLIIAGLLMSSCSIDQLLTQTDHPTPQKVQFIDDVTLSEGNKNNKSFKHQSQTYMAHVEEHQLPSGASIIKHKGSEIEIGQTTDFRLLKFIEDWYGVPYRFGGTTKGGIDCSAFVQELYGEVYQKDVKRTSREQFATSQLVKDIHELEEGDLVFFKIRTRDISHVGVYLGDGKFVHASRSRGVMISDLEHAYWKRYYVGGGKI